MRKRISFIGLLLGISLLTLSACNQGETENNNKSENHEQMQHENMEMDNEQ